MRVLVIDDEAILLLMDRPLQRADCRTTTCRDPRRSLAFCEAEPDAFAAVVSDHHLPTLAGLDVARAVTRLRYGMSVIVNSGFFDTSLAAQAREAGVAELVHQERLHGELRPALARAVGVAG